MPFANGNILSKPMITNVAAYGLSLSHIFFVVYKRQNVNRIKTYLMKEA
jgi:hypothetical protein